MAFVLILAFDTTSALGGVAVYRDAECLANAPNQGPANNFSVTLFQMAERALGEANLQPRDIELYAVANGPGSFTGIRVGLAAAQGWAKAFNRPVQGVSVLEAMVEEARPEAECGIPVLDARGGEFFLGLFRRAPGQTHFSANGEGLVLKPDALRSFLEGLTRGECPQETVTCLAREQDPSAQALRGTLPKSLGWQSVPGSLLGAIARLASRAHREGKLESPAALEACYIRRPEAEILFQTLRHRNRS